VAKSPEEITADMVAGLKEKTGKDLAAWQKILKASGLSKHGEMLKHLKSEHGVTHGFANLIVHKTLNSDAGSADGDDLIAAQYAGPKAGLRPLYDALLKAIAKFGGDVDVSPKKGYVSLRRGKQFALIQPSTATRLDIGLNLKGVEPTARLEASGSFNAMCSHRVRVAAAKDIDAELAGWLRAAYERA